MPQPKICVVAASNIDLNSYTPRLPKLGETMPGTRFTTGFGGKGANQAVMAAKLGGQVTVITRVGEDIFGADIRRNFADLGMDTTYVTATPGVATGVASIWIEEASGNNAMILALGANDLLAPADIEAARPAIERAQILVCQWEMQTETVAAALRIARQAGVTTIFNPAPARAEIPAAVYADTDILCPNESETELLTGMAVETLEQATAAAQVLLARGPRTVILTLGARGSLLVTADTVEHIPTPAVRAVDTTGAGDAFVGSLAYHLAAGKSLSQAMDRASRIAAISVQAPGTQTSFPSKEELPEEIRD
jgi:ribokinase